MGHLPNWLWNTYSKLYLEFDEDVFTFDEAMKILSAAKSRTLITLSHLRRRGWLIRFKTEGRRRIYRVLSPGDALFSAALMSNMDKIKQQRYMPLMMKTCRCLWKAYRKDFFSFVVYGSVARGSATNYSDVDVLVVVRRMGGSFGKRLDELFGNVAEVEVERRFLRKHGILTDVSFLPLSLDEASKFLPIYLDISHEGTILFDQHEFFTRLMDRFRFLLQKFNIRRFSLGDQWYWQMNPDLDMEEIKIEI